MVCMSVHLVNESLDASRWVRWFWLILLHFDIPHMLIGFPTSFSMLHVSVGVVNSSVWLLTPSISCMSRLTPPAPRSHACAISVGQSFQCHSTSSTFLFALSMHLLCSFLGFLHSLFSTLRLQLWWSWAFFLGSKSNGQWPHYSNYWCCCLHPRQIGGSSRLFSLLWHVKLLFLIPQRWWPLTLYREGVCLMVHLSEAAQAGKGPTM